MKILKKILAVTLVLLTLSGCGTKQKKEETRAMWISYIDYTQILWGKTEQEFKNNIESMILNMKEMNINTIYVHASAFTDAYYSSAVYPSAQYITGTIGEKLPFDPLKIIVQEAKQNKMRVEAWINPFRSFTKEQMATVPDQYKVKKWVNEGSRNVRYFNNQYYLNPAYQDVQDLILDVVKELVKHYEIDAIHMDDYFYPDQVSEDFDAVEYKASNTDLSLGDWRRNNVNTLVKTISSAIHKLDKKCQFSISPAGNIEFTTNTIYGDVATWIKEGWIDVVVPQIYFGFEHGSLPYDQCLKQWEKLVEGTDVELVVGLSAYKINTEDNYATTGKFEWQQNSDILARQIQLAKTAKNYQGYALFSYHSIFRADPNNAEAIQKELDNLKKIE